jgi:hypothetical protein
MEIEGLNVGKNSEDLIPILPSRFGREGRNGRAKGSIGKFL